MAGPFLKMASSPGIPGSLFPSPGSWAIEAAAKNAVIMLIL